MSIQAIPPTQQPSQSSTPTGLGDRPQNIQNVVNKVFENLASSPYPWVYNGQSSYELVGIDEIKMIRHIASRADGKKEIYILDIGAGNGKWGRKVANFIKSEFSQSDKRFHVINITGEKQFESGIKTEENVTEYNFNQFKIEDLEEELQKRELHLTDQVDFIITNWTLHHLVDPLGTLQQMCRLLTPGSGYLLSSDLPFSVVGVDADLFDGTTLCKFFSSLKFTTMLFTNCSQDNSKKYEFLFARNAEAPVDFPLKYSCQMCIPPRKYEINNQLARYVLDINLPDYLPFGKSWYYGFYGDEKSEKLFQTLESLELFSWQ